LQKKNISEVSLIANLNTSPLRHYTLSDRLIHIVATGLRTLTHQPAALRPNPATDHDTALSSKEAQHSAGLMRVNHTGEICAQALYLSQGLTARNSELRGVFHQAAQEENDHLAWCYERLQELNSHSSYLNPLWFTGAFCIGTLAGFFGDAWNLGFLAQTEEQVTAHLGRHLDILPKGDVKSRAIVTQMHFDEAQHAHMAMDYGAKVLPIPMQFTMQTLAKVMTTIVYYV
jgi:ubiquinone biosynthesis monooxygenase Coq7